MLDATNKTDLRIAPRSGSDQTWIERVLSERWGATKILSRGRTHDAADLPALVAWRGDQPCGLATFFEDDDEIELVTLDALQSGSGVGTALLIAFEQEARRREAVRCVLITSNDNLDALAFYQKRGWRLSALYPGAIDEARREKPSIPLVADNGIGIHDELELSLELKR